MPLILPSQRLIRPNPLAYPAGATPGVDRSHPAAALGPYVPVSVVCLNDGQLFDVVHGESATTITSVAWSQTIDSIGPVLSNFTSGGVASRPLSGAWDESRNVIAAVVRLPTAASGATSQMVLGTYDDVSGGYSIGIPGSSSSTLGYFEPSGTINLFFDYLANSVGGHAAFVAISSNGSTSFNWVVKSLTSGKVFYGTSSYTTVGGSPTQVMFGNRTTALNRPYAGSIAAGMFVGSARQLSIAQLRQWAEDPWSFWYPNKTINLASSAASVGASFLPVWAYRYNLPVLGTGNF